MFHWHQATKISTTRADGIPSKEKHSLLSSYSCVCSYCVVFVILAFEILKRGHTPRFLLVGLLNIQDPGPGRW